MKNVRLALALRAHPNTPPVFWDEQRSFGASPKTARPSLNFWGNFAGGDTSCVAEPVLGPALILAGVSLFMSVTMVLLASCSSLDRMGESHLTEIAGSDFMAPLPAGGDRIPRPGDTVRIMGTELRGNPRMGQRVWVKKATGVILTIEAGQMRIRILQGHAARGDRLLCCDPASPEVAVPARKEAVRARQAHRKRDVGAGSVTPVHVLGDSLGP